MAERTKVIAAAERLVEQWDKHDKYRETEADKALREGFDEPPEVAIARELLETTKHFERFVGFAATTRRENTYDWMRLFLDWLNGAATRLDSSKWFSLVGADVFTLHRGRTTE